MFAKIVSDVLNKFLGKYIENLDGSQLKIGVWGGDVELRDLDVKESALDELDLPVRLVCGHVGYLKLKIPWKNLFKERWEATVERVLVVVVPKTSIQYDAEKEEKLLQEGKMAALQRGEEARQKQQEMEKGDQSASQDGFFEKLCSQIIRNIQIFIKDIHIRYEDSLSCQNSQFAAGITLSNITMQSTGADWIPRLDASKLVYKLNTLDCLGIYWNPDAQLVAQNGHDKSEMIKCLKELITSQDYIPQGMNYIIGPICSSAKLQLNPKPEQPDEGGKVFSIPFVSLDFVMDELAVALTRRQYSGLMALLDSFDRLNLSSKYRKYRPQVHKVAGNAKTWWHYAYECQLENIRRVHQNWSWEHMKQHRARCRQYKAVYKAKLENKLTSALTKDLQECERVLDVFNITLVRRQAEMEVQREGRLRKQEKQKKGWFSGWLFGGGEQTTDDDKEEGNLAMKLKSAMTDEEKEKLHEAIGYSDSGPPPSYPEEFVDILLKFLLKQLTIRVTDEDTGGACVLHLKLDQVTSALENRSGASAVRVKASVQSLTVEGYPVEGPVPRLVTTETTTSGAPLLDVSFETNPLDKACDQRVKVVAQPLEVMYHARTIIQISDVFAPPKDVSLQQLQAAALNQLEVVKERSVTGLQTAIDNHSILDLNLSFAASHIIIPENGSYAENCSAIVVTLGSVQMQSKPRTRDAPALTQLVSMGHSQEEVMNIVRTSSYDKFIIELVDIQALVSLTAEDWRDTVSSGKASPLHLLEPTTLHVDLHKCLLTDDPNLAKVKIHISLPDVGLSVADERLLQLAYIIHSIPKGEKSEEPLEPSDFDQSDDLSRSVATDDVALVRLERTELRSAEQEQKETPQFTNLELSFVINEIRLELKKKLGSGYESLMKVAALSAKVEVAHRTFDLSVSMVLGGILVEYLKGGNYRLLSTPLAEGGDQAFLTLNFTQVNRKSPDFQVKYGSTMQHLHVMVSHLKAHLEQSAILSILAFVEQLTYKLGQLAPEQAEEAHPQTLESDTDTFTSKKQLLSKTLVASKRRVPDVTALKIFAKLGNVSLVIGHKSRQVAKVDVAGLIVNVTMKGQDTFITSQLKDFTVIDPSTTALHPKIVEIVGKEAWDVKVSLFGGATEGSHYLDMERVDTSITLTFGGARIVFLNKFVTDVLSWIDKFQAAKAALASASVAAAVAAQATLQEAYDKCARISMSFTLRAPLILVPQDSNSLSGLMVDLGLITIKNRFELGKERNELGYPAMFDKIQLELNQIKLSRVELSTEGTIERENNLLEPVSLTLTICRNLTISWLKQQPELDIQAKLKRIEISVSDEDFQVALSVLQDNLKEQTDTLTQDEPLVTEASDTMENVKDIDRVLAEHGHVFTKVKFSFTIEAVTVSLFTKRTIRLSSVSSDTLINLKDTAPSGSPSQECLSPVSSGDAASPCSFTLTPGRSKEAHRVIPDADYSKETPKEALSEISLKVVTLKGEMMSDGTLVTNLVLYDCVLQDTRPGQKDCINKMMERRATKGSRGMLDLTFRQGSSSDIFVDVRISGFILVLHLPYLLRIQRFFTDNLPKDPEDTQPQKTKEIAKPKVDKGPEEDQPRNAMTVRVKVEQPLIALVEDVSSINTSCIILHAEANCDIKMAPQHQNITANVANIEMYTCCFNPEVRQRTTAQIIDRCDVSFHHLVTPTQPGSIHVHLSQVNLRVSPAIIELLSTIATTLSGLEKADEEKTEEIPDWSGLWKVKPLTKEEFTLLDVEEGQEAIMTEGSEVAKPRPACKDGSGGEYAEVRLECFLITLEAGSSTSPIPLIKLQTSVNTFVTGFFSKKLRVKGDLNLELASFNPRLAVWEPLLEPVEKTTTVGQPEHKPWTFEFEVAQDMSGGESTVVSPLGTPLGSPDVEEVDFEEFHFPDPVCTISLTAKDPMELTVTKTFMEVVGILSEAFSEAYKRKVTDAKTLSAPYRIANYTGMHISVEVAQSGFKVATQGGEGVEQVTVESGAQVDLEEVKVLTPKHRRVASLVTDCQSIQDRRLVLKIPSLDCTCSIPVARADKRYFEVEHRNSGDKWGIVTSIAMESGCKVITLSSCVEVINHLDVPVEVYYMTERGNEVEAVVSLGPKESALLPLHAAYSPTAELFFCVEGHNVCILPFVWRLLQNNPYYEMKVSCPPKDVREVHGTPFLMFASGEVEQILWENTSRRTMKSTLYRVHLHPCLVLHNLLPVPISLEPPGTMTTNVIMPGASLNLTKAQLGTCYLELLLLDYLSRDWICGKPLEANPPELSVWTFKSRGDIMGGPLDLDLGMLAVKTQQRLSLSLYCPFWMINKSGLMLTYRGDTRNNIVVHEEMNNEPILFSFKSKAFFGKKKATVKVEDSEWSDKFSLDVVGSSGSVLCKAPNKNYQVGVDIQLGNSGLTKIVVFTPFYNILNKASYDIEVAEVDVPQAEWFTVMAGECIGWWPVGSKHQVYVRVRGTQDTTAAFPYDRPLSTVLALPNMYGGILGEVSMKESGVVIQFDQYCEGAAPALLINHLTDTTISIWQQGHDHQKVSLTPMSVKHFTWKEPGGTLAVCGSVGANRPITLTLDKDDQGSTPDQAIHWAVFLQNQQRCVLFIDDIHIASAALNAAMLERFQQEVILSLNSIGLSLVDDINRKEVAYISLASSGVVWEHCKQKGRKHRPFTQAQTELLEKCYQLYHGQVKTMPDASCIESHYVITRNLEVDYAKMTVSKPFHRKIRRTFQPGVRLEFRQSTHQRQIHLKVNSLQVDNQACDVMFPVVLARVPTPRSVMADTVPKPFCEVSVAQKVISPMLTQFKYFAVLIQEFHAKVELPFVFAVMEVLMPTRDVSTDLYSVEKYEKDEKIVHGTLTSKVKSQAGEGRKDYFDTLHLSPIKMHLSFSLSATDSGSAAPVGSQVIHLFLQSVGVTLTEVQDVVFRLAYMERQNQWMSWNQLVQEMIAHYQGQVMKQLYVLVLGLDVIGNPFGLVVGFTKGVEDLFYEPIQGAIEGPGEFAEGMMYGVTSFMGKTVGGAAGAVSRITGTIGKGVAALTLDDDYQKRRREAMHRKPADGIESLARGGKGIVTGVVDGVTGVFLKPIDGAREEGVEGFFKGMGKGVVGLVTRPASGVIDFASGSFDAVMRATDSTEEIMRRRPARFIAADGVIRPFVLHYAQGTRMLQEIEKGRYAKTDVYVAHSNIAMSKSVLVATDKRVMQVTRNDILGYLKVEWVHSFDEMSEPPVLTPNGLRLSVKQEKRRVLGVFGGGSNAKVVQLGSVEQNHVSRQRQDLPPSPMHGRSDGSTFYSNPPPQHPQTAPQSPNTSPQYPSKAPQNPDTRTSWFSGSRARQTASPAPRRGLFGVVGTIGSGISKIGRDVAEGVSKAATGQGVTRTSVPSGNTGRGSRFRARAAPPPPVAQSVPQSEAPEVCIEWENVVKYVEVQKEDSTMQWFLSELSAAYIKHEQ